MDPMTPQQVGEPLLNAVQKKQPTPQELLAEIQRRSRESMDLQKADADATRTKLGELKGKKKPLDLTPFAMMVDAMTGSKHAPIAQAMYKQQAGPAGEAKRLEELLRKQQGALSDDEINMLKLQYKQQTDDSMSFADKEALKHKNAMLKQGNYFDMQEGIAEMKIDAKKKAALLALGDPNGRAPTSKAQEKMDIEWGKKNQDYYDKVRPKITTNLRLLHDVKAKLGTRAPETGGFVSGGSNLTGKLAGIAIGMGTTAGAVLNSEAAHAYDRIRQVVQQDLRETLGAQFTEKEGQMMINATYNPALSEEKNAQNLQILIDKVEQIASIKDQEQDYFDKHQTLRGMDRKKMRAEMDAVIRPFIDELEQKKKMEDSGTSLPSFEEWKKMKGLM